MSKERVIPINLTDRISALKRKASMAAVEDQLPLLAEISRILGDQDVGLLLSLSMRSFHLGDDDLAAEYLNRAVKLEPDGQAVLRVKAFLSLAAMDPKWQEDFDDLLSKFPSDNWARAMRAKALAGDTSSLSLPNVYGPWGLG